MCAINEHKCIEALIATTLKQYDINLDHFDESIPLTLEERQALNSLGDDLFANKPLDNKFETGTPIIDEYTESFISSDAIAMHRKNADNELSDEVKKMIEKKKEEMRNKKKNNTDETEN